MREVTKLHYVELLEINLPKKTLENPPKPIMCKIVKEAYDTIYLGEETNLTKVS